MAFGCPKNVIISVMYVVFVMRLKISDGLFLITSFHSGFIRYSKSELNTYLIDKYLTPSIAFT